ncbi:hypothetical protein F5X71_12430 [Nocardia brasiliensis]|uniref:Uncharacterized protein n=1 Tax=Nocardia brasiliensis TaxID=37326 RepID=A0A6G9XPY2_NOCBR|nr:hypothetical protein [Nocardia brasiliensis]QIS03012.1 hypothetical protein F5X71_12430 [Nocardia brasiliensis]
MRRTVLVVATLVTSLAGFTAAAGPAGAVDDKQTCTSVRDMATELNSGINGAKSKDAGAADEVRSVFSTAATKLETTRDLADDGPVKTAIDPAVTQMRRVSTASDTELGTVLQDQAFHDAMSGLDQACGI